MSTKRAKGPATARLKTSQGVSYLATAALLQLSKKSGDRTAFRDALIEASLSDDHEAVSEVFRRLREAGLSDRAILFDLIPFAVDTLGEHWMKDVMSWSEVTVATARLQTFVRNKDLLHGPAFENSGRVLIIVPTGENHSFGASILEKRIAALGHYAELSIDNTPEEIVSEYDINNFDLIALSAYRPESLPFVMDAVRAIKEIRPTIPCVMGGRITDYGVSQVPDIALVTNDLHEALKLAGLSSDPVLQEQKNR